MNASSQCIWMSPIHNVLHSVSIAAAAVGRVRGMMRRASRVNAASGGLYSMGRPFIYRVPLSLLTLSHSLSLSLPFNVVTKTCVTNEYTLCTLCTTEHENGHQGQEEMVSHHMATFLWGRAVKSVAISTCLMSMLKLVGGNNLNDAFVNICLNVARVFASPSRWHLMFIFCLAPCLNEMAH